VVAPVETVSLSEDGFERVVQGVSITPVWRVGLAPASIAVALAVEPRGD
jgi:hypothetical protein